MRQVDNVIISDECVLNKLQFSDCSFVNVSADGRKRVKSTHKKAYFFPGHSKPGKLFAN